MLNRDVLWNAFHRKQKNFANWVFFLLKKSVASVHRSQITFHWRKKSTNANGFMFATKGKESLKFKMSQESKENAWKREREKETNKKWIVKRTIFPELSTVQLLFAYFNIRMSTETQNEISWNGFKLFRIFFGRSRKRPQNLNLIYIKLTSFHLIAEKKKKRELLNISIICFCVISLYWYFILPTELSFFSSSWTNEWWRGILKWKSQTCSHPKIV